MDDDPHASLEATFAQLGYDPEDIELDSGGSILRPPTAPELRAATSPLPSLLDRAAGGAGPPRLVLGDPIGEGAMGIVRVATQVPLKREIAVKSLKQQIADSGAERALVLEARVTGALEHPNIVPVYMLGLDESGRPAMVMRRLEGVPWRDFISHEGDLRTPEAGVDPLEWHLRVLIQVCNAVHYAHRKGVIHRDLKALNVMIGSFGEVYVLDWGLAVASAVDNPWGLPPASGVIDVIGTPGSMAPEMIDVRQRAIGPRTDVYLLGTCLHTVLTGRPRHDASTVRERMLSALRSDPFEYGPAVPGELAGICHTAMHRDPMRRFQSAAALRQAIEAFLTHRSSLRLTDEAAARATRLRAVLRRGDAPVEQIHNLFAECRYGFRQALDEWNGNAKARAGLQHLLETMIVHELEHGDPRRAHPLISELPEPRPNLEAAVGAQLKAEGRELEKLRRIEQEVDTRIGSHERARIMQLMGAVFAAVYVTLATLSHSGIFDAAHGTMYAINLLYGVALGVATWMFRDTLRANRVNRRFAVGMGIPFAVPVLYWPVAMWKGVPFAEAIGVIELIYFMSSALIAAAIDFRLLWPAAIYLVAFVINAALPEYCYEILAAATLAALGLAANMIRHPSRTAPKNRASLPSMPG